MKTAPLAEVGANLSDYVERSHSGPVVLTRDGRPVAVLFGIGDDDELERLVLAHSSKFRALLEKSRQEIRDGKGIPHDEFWKEFPRPAAAPQPKRRKPAAKAAGRRSARPAPPA